MVKNELELHWLSTSRISPAENRVHTSFDLHSYCEAIEDHLFSRALIGAVYQCLLQGILFLLSCNRKLLTIRACRKYLNFLEENTHLQTFVYPSQNVIWMKITIVIR